MGASPTGFVIQIIATHGGGNLGDIAIDELTNCVKSKNFCDCDDIFIQAFFSFLAPTVATPTAASADFPLDSSCDFETNLCSWTNSPDDEVDWVPHSGGTYGTGPTNDHTYGTPRGKKRKAERVGAALETYGDRCWRNELRKISKFRTKASIFYELRVRSSLT